MSNDRKFEWPEDPLDAWNARLDFEYEHDRHKILYTDAVAKSLPGNVPSRSVTRR